MMSRNFTPEQELVDQLTAGNAEALEELSRRYSYSIYAYCQAKLNSREDAKRIVRNVFICLWENRDRLPEDFSVSSYLYTEVRKSVVQCVNGKLRTSTNVQAIERQIIPGFSVAALQKAKQFVDSTDKQKSRYTFSSVKVEKYEEQWWSKVRPAVNLKGLKHGIKNMLNLW